MQTCYRSVQKRSDEVVGRRHEVRAPRQRQDILRRFARTPHAISLQWMNRTVTIESNNSSLLDLFLKFFERYQQGTTGEAAFKWRLVCERDEALTTTAVPVSAFSEVGLRYASIGQRGFLAVDLSKREGVAFIPEVFLERDAMFHTRHPLDALFCLTASSLGLVSLSGGCVANGERGVMVFGPPNSGKTTACYLAAKSGLEFLADQMLFLDLQAELLAWGDSLNAVFRPSALEFLPELQKTGFHSNYGGVSFLYYDKSHMQLPKARPVVPACSLFLLRCSKGVTQLRDMSPDESVCRLRECLLFEEDACFDQQIHAALQAAVTRPVYELRYPDDPKIAADFIRELLRC
jgi:hypothetical protein